MKKQLIHWDTMGPAQSEDVSATRARSIRRDSKHNLVSDRSSFLHRPMTRGMTVHHQTFCRRGWMMRVADLNDLALVPCWQNRAELLP